MLAYCGLQCNTCLVFIATFEKDRSKKAEMRKSIAQKCSETYNMKFRPDEITDCDGCKANSGRLFSGCISCKIRKCASEKRIESCAFCSDFTCAVLKDHFLLDADAQKRLEHIRELYYNCV